MATTETTVRSTHLSVRFEIPGEKSFQRNWENLEKVPDNWTVPFWQMYDDFLENNQETFEQEGPGWPQLAPSTMRDRARNGFGMEPILVRTGALQLSLSERGAPGSIFRMRPTGANPQVEMGTSIRYAMYHQTGSIKVANHPPKRSPIDIRTALRYQWKDRILKWLRDGFDYTGR